MATVSRALVIRNGDDTWFVEPEVVDGCDFVEITPGSGGLAKLVKGKVRTLHRSAWFDALKARRMQKVMDIVCPPPTSNGVVPETARAAKKRKTVARSTAVALERVGGLPITVDVEMPSIECEGIVTEACPLTMIACSDATTSCKVKVTAESMSYIIAAISGSGLKDPATQLVDMKSINKLGGSKCSMRWDKSRGAYITRAGQKCATFRVCNGCTFEDAQAGAVA